MISISDIVKKVGVVKLIVFCVINYYLYVFDEM